MTSGVFSGPLRRRRSSRDHILETLPKRFTRRRNALFCEGETETPIPGGDEAQRDTLDKDVDTTKGWSTLRNSTDTHDKGMIERWRDELNNLLIFAGLFSAVATAFTIESYQWLQPDPADTSLKYLERISLQLSSFTSGTNMLNSTIPPLTENDPSLTPVLGAHAVKINILWILSLTLSLVATFFAITVHQWLRHYPVPQHLSLKDAVRLRQSRYSGLVRWKVPEIVSLLPILLQVAVVLFLVGLLYLLYDLNQTVARAICIAFGVSFGIFVLTAVMPVLRTSCPYKTPLVPTVVAILRICAIPIAGLVVIILMVALILYVIVMACLGQDGTARCQAFSSLLARWILSTVESILSRDLDRFWTVIEMRGTTQDNSLDHAALSYAPFSVPHHELPLVSTCSQDLPQRYRTQVALQWLTIKLTGDSPMGRKSPILRDNLTPIDSKLLKRIDREMAEEVSGFLIASMPQDWSTKDWFAHDGSLSYCFVLMHRITKIEPDIKMDGQRSFHKEYLHCLLKARQHQKFDADNICIKCGRIPPVLIYDYYSTYQRDKRAIELPDLKTCLDWTADFDSLNNGNYHSFYWFYIREIMSSSTALALMAAMEKPFLLQDKEIHSSLQEALGRFDAFLVAHTRQIQSTARLYHTKPDIYEFIFAPKAFATICCCIADLVEGGNLAPDDSMRSLTRHLQGVIEGHGSYFGSSQEDLERLEQILLEKPDADVAEEDGRIGFYTFQALTSEPFELEALTPRLSLDRADNADVGISP